MGSYSKRRTLGAQQVTPCRLSLTALPRRRANTLARDGPGQPLLVATVADRFTRGVDTAVARRVRHNPAAQSDKILFAYHAVPVLDEIQQEVEHLRLKREELRAPPKLPAIRIEYLIFKLEIARSARSRMSLM